MCSATVGATPVNRCTVAASSIFSSGVRGTPSCGKTLNRVPELPYPQDGVSMVCWRSAAFTAFRSVMLHLSVGRAGGRGGGGCSSGASAAADAVGVEQRGQDEKGTEGEQLELAAVRALEGEQDAGIEPDDEQRGDDHASHPADAARDGDPTEHGDRDSGQSHSAA